MFVFNASLLCVEFNSFKCENVWLIWFDSAFIFTFVSCPGHDDVPKIESNMDEALFLKFDRQCNPVKAFIFNFSVVVWNGWQINVIIKTTTYRERCSIIAKINQGQRLLNLILTSAKEHSVCSEWVTNQYVIQNINLNVSHHRKMFHLKTNQMFPAERLVRIKKSKNGGLMLSVPGGERVALLLLFLRWPFEVNKRRTEN